MSPPGGKPLFVRPLQAGEEIAWDRFVTTQPQGSFFHLAGWKRVIEESLAILVPISSRSATATSPASCRSPTFAAASLAEVLSRMPFAFMAARSRLTKRAS